MTTLKTTVPPAVYERADAKARAEGTTISAVLRAGLMAWLDEPEVSDRPDTSDPTPAQWSELVQWVRDNPDEWVRYTGPRDTRTAADRRAVYQWFLETVNTE